jgi:hypothetical protein
MLSEWQSWQKQRLEGMKLGKSSDLGNRPLSISPLESRTLLPKGEDMEFLASSGYNP